MASTAKNHHWCFVPMCTNTGKNTPDKRFITVPNDIETRKLWWRAAHRAYPITKATSYCCEDHFDLEDDLQNYRYVITMGGFCKLKKGVLPHKFDCQGRGATLDDPSPLTAAEQNIEDGNPGGTSSVRAVDGVSEDGNLGQSALPAWKDIGIQMNLEVKQEPIAEPDITIKDEPIESEEEDKLVISEPIKDKPMEEDGPLVRKEEPQEEMDKVKDDITLSHRMPPPKYKELDDDDDDEDDDEEDDDDDDDDKPLAVRRKVKEPKVKKRKKKMDDDEDDDSEPVDDESRQKNRKRKAPDPTEELVKLASKRLQQPQDDSDIVAAAWAVKLRKMDPQQQLFAKKAINEILFEGQMGTLHRSSVEINVSRVATPYSVQSLPSPSVPQYESASASSQHTGGYYTTLQ